MRSLPAHQPDPGSTLAKAVLNAGKALGLTQADVGAIVGRDRSALHRGALDPASKPGELALLLIRTYRSLFALVGGQEQDLQHWMHTENRHIGGVPAEQVRSVQGLTTVVAYLDAIRGKT